MTGFRHYRPARPTDAEQIAVFNRQLAEETEGRMLDPDTVRRGVLRGLQQYPEVRYFVVEEAARGLIGQLMFTREWSDWRNGWMLWLQSVYIVRDCRGQGVFRTLLQTALDNLTAEDTVVGIRLYVDRSNTTARQVYEKLGFQDPGYDFLERCPES